MTTAGWIILFSSITPVTVVFIWCFWKVLSTPQNPPVVHGFETEPPDVEEEKRAHRPAHASPKPPHTREK